MTTKKMATWLRSVVKLSCRLSHLHRIPVKTRIVAQPACSIFTSNKKKDAATSTVVSEKEVKEVERLDNLLEKDEVYLASSSLHSRLATEKKDAYNVTGTCV